MAKKVQVTVKDDQNKETTFGTKTLTKLFNSVPQGTNYKVFIQENTFGQQFVGNYVTKSPPGEPPGPEPNVPPIIEITSPINAIQHSDVTMNAKITDTDGTLEDVNWIQKMGPTVLVTEAVNGDIYSGTFTAHEPVQYAFDVEAIDNQQAKTTRQVIVNVSTTPPPPPPQCPDPNSHFDAAQNKCVCNVGFHDDGTGMCVPDTTPPPTGTILYDSHVDSKLHDGQVRTVKSEGSITPNGKGVECRASGNPRLRVNADGTFSLLCDSGHGRLYFYVLNYNAKMILEWAFWNNASGQDNSMKMRSRHNEPGKTCSGGSPIEANRFGGYGLAIDRSGWNAKREPTHNCHDQSKSGSTPVKPDTQKFVKTVFTVKDDGSGKVKQLGSINGQQFMDKTDDSPKPFMVDAALYAKQSYFWIRQNISSGTGELRIKSLVIEKA